MRECRFCHTNLETLAPEASIFQHEVGLCAPSHREVEAAIAQLEIEDEREKEAIRKFWDRERPKPAVSQRALQAVLIACGVTALLLIFELWRAMQG